MGTPTEHVRDVVIIGGGVMGTSSAYHLARAGVRSVTLLESGELGGGSSAKPLGGVRAVFSDPANIALGARSLAAYTRFGREVGVDIGLQQVGYLFVIRNAADVPAFEHSVALQNAMGVPTRIIGPAEAVAQCPYLSGEDLVAAVWSPDDGFARPADVVRGYAAGATGLGVEIRTGAPVSAVEATPDGRARVHTTDGVYRASAVVCTAGAWSGRVATLAGVDLPIHPLRRQVAFTAPLTPPPGRVPFTIDYSTTAYFHGTEDGGLLMGWADPLQTPGFGREVSTDWHESLRAAVRTIAPGVADAPLVSGWAGLYEMTPDCNAVIGESDAGFRFLYAAGFSGHGFLQAPAVGECVTDLYLRRRPVVDVSGFALERFGQPAVRTELAIV
ncbi:NAD(P)/FAD-dependent oxidoreductase [uncultured Friedmanniella sp.]|uniref:NAD(P)/FAD-dependent oxidoreductase n=1 Tax=uncultured Friedmanniella sp. TaxID=335381 RepID=UPI0035CA41E9